MEESMEESSASSSDDNVAEKIVKAKKLKKTKSAKEVKKPKKSKSLGDPFNVASSKSEFTEYILIGKKDAVVMSADKVIGVAKYKQAKTEGKPSFFYCFEFEPDSHKHLLEGVAAIVDLKEKQTKKK